MNIQTLINSKQLEAINKLKPVKSSDRERRLITISLRKPTPDTAWIEIDNLQTDQELSERKLLSFLKGKDYDKQQELRRYFSEI